MIKSNVAFAMNEPSLFVLQTPFQILCAAAAIKSFGISDYEILLVLPLGEIRNRQAIHTIKKLGLHYKIINGARVSNRYRLSLPISIRGTYRRAFLGFYAFEDGYYYCLKYLKFGGDLVLLDDGVATITLLEKGFSPHGRKRFVYKYYFLLLKLRGIGANNIFTIYSGIENAKWKIKINNLSILNFEQSGIRQGVFFVGTNSVSYYPALRNGETEYKEMVSSNLRYIRNKYPDERITYIPHGRDKVDYIRDFCAKYNIEYRKIETNIELFMMDLPNPPKVIFGYTSSALFNLKKIFPRTEINNILPEVNETLMYEDMKIVSNYYETQGITTLTYKREKDEN